MELEKIDRNFAVKSTLDLPDVEWHDVRQAPFRLYGLYQPLTEPEFKRIPTELATRCFEGILPLHTNTSGGRVRFATDSPYIALKAEMKNQACMCHMPRSGQSSFDLYWDNTTGGYDYKYTLFCPVTATEGFETVADDARVLGHRFADFILHFPTYDNVTNLYIGIKKGSRLTGGKCYAHEDKPVVFAGSSITQGGCVCRPGNAYPNIVARDLDTDILNLGFSGSFRGDQPMMDYIASLPMSAFVYDYDHNAPNAEHLAKTHLNGYLTFRAKQPDTPIVFLSKPDWANDPDAEARQAEILKTVQYATDHGDKNIRFLDGKHLWDGIHATDCTVDNCHPNDTGHLRMALKVEAALKELLGW